MSAFTERLCSRAPGDPYLPVFSNGLAGATTADNTFGASGVYGEGPAAGAMTAPSLLDMGLDDLPGVNVERG
ncbi:MAG: hypothetical protein AB1938_18695 [Myxococcota bacterium]